MATKEFEVLKTVKVDGIEHGPGSVVKLEDHQAQRLSPVFVSEYVKPAADPAPAPATKKSGKGGDGL